MAINPIEPTSEILGYRLEKRIGSGGFGEVWSAEAPGGLKKAIKIVYGYHDEKRALSELKALDRVKSLRHPFLLSLERIEIFENQLVVVTELADASMADLFNEYAAKGESGIPREELLKYISNAADALDFLAAEKSLQHLDIKPENLLIVSGHVKVADFGLMKDLQVATQSLMQGMTPAYAPPELFDGRPANSSDQYSLAIVYAEMLTGVRPFSGSTPAQLAAQHMHGKPNLRALPKSDQAAIARALTKDPNARHPNCVAFVDDLKKQKRSIKKTLRRQTATNRHEENSSSETLVFQSSNSSVSRDATEMMGNNMLPIQAEQIQIASPPDFDPNRNSFNPALIVTVGDTANRIGQKTKCKLVSRVGNPDCIPAIQSVYIDSDRKALGRLEMLRTNPVSTLESVHVPLRKPEDYRSNAEVHLNWLSRRWIYNVPRTLQTEGLRPLGRLVFADHFNTICDTLERAIDELAKAENLADTCESLEMLPGEVTAPQIYLITSISGGIGSGMALDLAYTIKLLLAEKGLRDDNVTAILLHSSYQRQRDPGLATANTFAFMTEMRHFNEYGYPGDETLGIPEFEEEQPFANTYYVELGDDLSQSEHEKRLGQIAEYVSLSTASRCRPYFEACRANEFQREHFGLRSLGLSVSGIGDPSLHDGITDRLGQNLVTRWINSNPEPATIEQKFDELVSEFDLDPDSISKLVSEETLKKTKSQKGDQIQKLIGVVEANDEIESAITEHLDGYFGAPRHRRDASHVEPELAADLDQWISTHPVSGEYLLARKVAGLVDSRGNCLSLIRHVIDKIGEQLQEPIDSARNKCEELFDEISNVVSAIHRSKNGFDEVGLDTVESLCGQLFELREQEFVQRYTSEFFRVVNNGLEPVRSQLDNYKTNLECVREEFCKTVALEFDFGVENDAFDLQKLLINKIEASIKQLARKSELQVFGSIIETTGTFSNALSDMSYWRYQLPAEIREAAHIVLRKMYETISIDEIIEENGVAPEQLVQWLNCRVIEARPRVADCGGEMRLLFAFPAFSENPETNRVIGANLNFESLTMQGSTGSLVVCFEAEDISFASVAFRLMSQRPDAIELVKRISSRSDIDWTTLDDLF